MQHPPASSAASDRHISLSLVGSTASTGTTQRGAEKYGIWSISLNLVVQRSWRSSGSSKSHSIPFKRWLSSFSCSLKGSQSPIGSQNSAILEATSLLEIFTSFRTLTTSAGLTTGKALGFFAPLFFLLKLSSSNPGNMMSSSGFQI